MLNTYISSPAFSAGAAAPLCMRFMVLLLHDHVHLSCCSTITSIIADAPGSHPLQPRLPDRVHCVPYLPALLPSKITCFTWVVSVCSLSLNDGLNDVFLAFTKIIELGGYGCPSSQRASMTNRDIQQLSDVSVGHSNKLEGHSLPASINHCLVPLRSPLLKHSNRPVSSLLRILWKLFTSSLESIRTALAASPLTAPRISRTGAF